MIREEILKGTSTWMITNWWWIFNGYHVETKIIQMSSPVYLRGGLGREIKATKSILHAHVYMYVATIKGEGARRTFLVIHIKEKESLAPTERTKTTIGFPIGLLIYLLEPSSGPWVKEKTYINLALTALRRSFVPICSTRRPVKAKENTNNSQMEGEYLFFF